MQTEKIATKHFTIKFIVIVYYKLSTTVEHLLDSISLECSHYNGIKSLIRIRFCIEIYARKR